MLLLFFNDTTGAAPPPTGTAPLPFLSHRNRIVNPMTLLLSLLTA
jgi:hypothetical protein